MSKTNIRPMIEVALFATIAYILDLVTQPMSLGPWISLSFKMVPIFLLSFRWGLKAGAMGGLIWGLLQVVTGQAAGNKVKSLMVITEGILLGSFARYLIHFIAGVIFWGSYAPKGQSPYLYSFIVNSSSFLGETLASLIVFFALQRFLGRLLNTEK